MNQSRAFLNVSKLHLLNLNSIDHSCNSSYWCYIIIDLGLKTQMLLQAYLCLRAMNGFMIQLTTYFVLLIFSGAGSSSSYCRIHAGSSSCKVETSYLTLNRPGFLESSTAGGRAADSFPPPPCNFPIWTPLNLVMLHYVKSSTRK